MLALFLAFMTIRTQKLVSFDEPYLSTMTEKAEGRIVDLFELDFFFAVEKPDPRVAYVEAFQTDWLGFGDRSGKERYEIEFFDCKEFLPGGLYEDVYAGTNKMTLIESLFVKHSTTFLCPNIDRLVV